MADVVERFERQPAHQGGIADHDRDALEPVAQVARLGQSLGDGQARAGVAAIEDVMRRFRATREPADAIERAQRSEALQAAGEQLVRVGLVARVPHDPVARRLQEPVEGDRELDDPERGAEVAAGLGDGGDDRGTDLGRELGQLRLIQAAQVGGVAEVGEQGHGVRGSWRMTARRRDDWEAVIVMGTRVTRDRMARPAGQCKPARRESRVSPSPDLA